MCSTLNVRTTSLNPDYRNKVIHRQCRKGLIFLAVLTEIAAPKAQLCFRAALTSAGKKKKKGKNF